MSDSDGDGRDVEDGTCAVDLDDWGWDPSVDAFLEELVEEAPRCGSAVDFAWVAESFLEVLEPTSDQAADALIRFSPMALAQRWLHLQRRQKCHAAAQKDEEAKTETFTVAAREAHASSALVGDHDTCDRAADSNVGAACPAGADLEVDGPQLPQFECSSVVSPSTSPDPPGRDRVLDAMQSFLFGVPRQSPAFRPQGRRPVRDPLPKFPIDQAEAVKEPASFSVGEAEPGVGPCVEGTEEPVMGLPSGRQEDAEVGILERRLSGKVAVASGSTRLLRAKTPTNSEALRLCLEELHWHGEALNNCAGGGDAGTLAREARLRRAAMFRYLSGLDVREAADGFA